MLSRRFVVLLAVISAMLGETFHSVFSGDAASAKTESTTNATAAETSTAEDDRQKTFDTQIQPMLKKYCVSCHNVDKLTSGVRVDHLTGALEDRQMSLWKAILHQVTDEAMPPLDEPQLTAKERTIFEAWISEALVAAKSQKRPKNGSARRLTVAQYRNTLRDLLGLEDDLTEVLPPDAISKDGFLNNGQTLQLSPLLVEAYFDIAEKALDLCIVDESAKPMIQNFRMDLGAGVNPNPIPDKLILGALSRLLENQDFMVSELAPQKPFPYEPFAMRTKYEFIEGYEGNATVRGWRKYDSLYHAVFACVRGTDGYPYGKAYEPVPQGLLLRPAIPSPEIFGQSSTYGPWANFKISLRELPDFGRFRVTVMAARYDDALLLDANTPIQSAGGVPAVFVTDFENAGSVTLPEAGIYQLDIHYKPGEKDEMLSVTLGDRHFSSTLPKKGKEERQPSAFMIVRLPAGEITLNAQFPDQKSLEKFVFTRLSDDSELAKQFVVFEQRNPRLGVHVGLRRDCGSTLAPVEVPKTVSSREFRPFVFEGAIKNYPSPDVEKDNVNYLAGIREIGIRSEYTDGRMMPRLLIRSVEFEGPLYETWPPETHRQIFIDSPHKGAPPAYARDIIQTFARRAFRRPVTASELDALVSIWKGSFDETGDFQQSITDALLAVLTSPQFLFLIENSQTPEPEPLDSYELASKLSYFLWNTAPDERLLDLAASGQLQNSLDAETERMVQDPQFHQFISQFASQWLSLEKFDVVEIDRQRFPKLTRDTRTQLREEPVQFLEYLLQKNLPARNLVQSDFLVANEVTASYYDLGDKTQNGFAFVPIPHANDHLGGILSQAGILAGLSDGREPNPVKRGAWFARKIIAEPPEDPPPNVPALAEDTRNLTLRERLERHRNQPGCAKCHSGIDPWGVPFEQFDASGLFRNGMEVDARSVLPDQTEVIDFKGLKEYLVDDRMDQVAFSFLKHLSTYATGRSLTYNELEFLKENGLKLRSAGYRMQDMLKFVIQSPLFLEK